MTENGKEQGREQGAGLRYGKGWFCISDLDADAVRASGPRIAEDVGGERLMQGSVRTRLQAVPYLVFKITVRNCSKKGLPLK